MNYCSKSLTIYLDPSCGDTHQDVIGGAERAFTSCQGWTGGDPKDMMECEEIERLLKLGREINSLCQEIVNPPEDLVRRMHVRIFFLRMESTLRL